MVALRPPQVCPRLELFSLFLLCLHEVIFCDIGLIHTDKRIFHTAHTSKSKECPKHSRSRGVASNRLLDRDVIELVEIVVRIEKFLLFLPTVFLSVHLQMWELGFGIPAILDVICPLLVGDRQLGRRHHMGLLASWAWIENVLIRLAIEALLHVPGKVPFVLFQFLAVGRPNRATGIPSQKKVGVVIELATFVHMLYAVCS